MQTPALSMRLFLLPPVSLLPLGRAVAAPMEPNRICVRAPRRCGDEDAADAGVGFEGVLDEPPGLGREAAALSGEGALGADEVVAVALWVALVAEAWSCPPAEGGLLPADWCAMTA